ncbi:hypothetical protein [Ruminococcus albus]|uniref:Uncharacterized protein n=1 Tax=Ruminococcus albus TaxID=1264 RepID=A0A1H7LND6_RUMAL|nr:hypothetical protein [Ruminococcus albus]SEL00416.1 hypothetical protein SAMN05216469_10991 [Ruminococcus albus]
MTNKEKYQRTFSVLHASELDLEETAMNKRKGIRISKRITAVCAAAAIVAAMSVGAYAADIGGIQRKVQIWFHGDQTAAVLDIQQQDSMTQYELKYTDENGEEREVHGGGVALDAFGNETPLSEDDIMEHISNQVEVLHKEDGSVWAYYKGCSMDITDKFDEDGYCYVQLKDGDDVIYLTVEPDGGYCTSSDKFITSND